MYRTAMADAENGDQGNGEMRFSIPTTPIAWCCSAGKARSADQQHQEAIATADAHRPVAVAEKIRPRARGPIMRLSDPGRVGITNSPMAGMNTSMEPGDDPRHGQRQCHVEEGPATGGLPRSADASEQRMIQLLQGGGQGSHHEGQIGIDDSEVDRECGAP